MATLSTLTAFLWLALGSFVLITALMLADGRDS